MSVYEIDSFAVDGVELGFAPGSLSVENIGNGRKILRAIVRSYKAGDGLGRTKRIRRRESCILIIEGVTQFDGVVWETSETKLFENVGNVQTFVAVDWGKLTERVLINAPVPSNTLETQMSLAIANMSLFGITVDPAQDDGPTLGNDAWEFQTIRQVLERLAANSGWVTKFNGQFAQMIEPGVTAAPFDINLIEQNWVSLRRYGSLEDYWNSVVLRYGPRGQLQVTEDLGNNAILTSGDPSGRKFRLTEQMNFAWLTAQVAAGLATVAVHRGATITVETLDMDPDAGTADWHFDLGLTYDNAIVQDSGGTLVDTLSGEFVRIVFQADFPGAAFSFNMDEIAEFGPATALLEAPGITDRASAQSMADGRLAQIEGENEYVEVVSREMGLEPFQALPVDVEDHDLDGSFLILSTTMTHIGRVPGGRHLFEWRCIAVEGNAYKLNWEQFFRSNTGNPGAGGGAPIADFGCRGGQTIFFDDWNAVASPEERWDSIGTPGTLELVDNGVGGSQACARVDNTTINDQTMNVAFTATPIAEGCLEFRYRSDAGNHDTQIFGLNPTGLLGFSISISRLNDGGNTERCRIFVNDRSGTPTTYTLMDTDNFFSQTALDWYRLEFKISTWNGSFYLGDGYVRFYKNGVRVLNAENLAVIASASPEGRGAQNLQFRCQGITDNVVLRGTDLIGPSASISASPSGSSSPSISPSSSTSPSSSLSSSPSASVSPSPGNSPSPSPTPSSSVSPSASSSSSASLSPSSSVSPSPSRSASASVSPSQSPSSSVSPSADAGFPAVTGRSGGFSNPASTSHTINFPSFNIGDLLLVVLTVNNNPTYTVVGTGWNSMVKTNVSTVISGQCFYKIADGTDTLSITTSSSEISSHRTLKIEAGTFNASTILSTNSSTGTGIANPPSHTPPGGALDYLWLVTYQGDMARPSAPPTNYSDMRTGAGSGDAISSVVAERELNASSEDPGAWTVGSDNYMTRTIAIHPN